MENFSNQSSSLSRRELMKLTPIALAGMGAAALLASPQDAAEAQAATGIYNVKDYGAVGNGTTDDAPAIQNAINAASGIGGIVWFPPGKYRLGSGLTISSAIILEGVGWSGGHTAYGSWLYINSAGTGFHPITITSTGRGTIIRNLAMQHQQPAPGPGWVPGNFPFAIYVQADDVWLQNILLFNPTRGIYLRNPSATVGRISLDRIWGQPLLVGIEIENAQDVIKIHNVHFWVFWNQDPNVLYYVLSSATAIRSYRNDNPHFSNIFVYGYSYGIHFGSSANGPTHRFRLANVDCDLCGIGLLVNGSGTTGQLANFTTHGAAGKPVGIHIQANNVMLQGTNIRITDYDGNGVRVEGAGSVAMWENIWIEDWNGSLAGFPAIEALLGTTVYLGRGRYFTNGHGGANTGGGGTFYQDA